MCETEEINMDYDVKHEQERQLLNFTLYTLEVSSQKVHSGRAE